jgi:hypothetical protein
LVHTWAQFVQLHGGIRFEFKNPKPLKHQKSKNEAPKSASHQKGSNK